MVLDEIQLNKPIHLKKCFYCGAVLIKDNIGKLICPDEKCRDNGVNKKQDKSNHRKSFQSKKKFFNKNDDDLTFNRNKGFKNRFNYNIDYNNPKHSNLDFNNNNPNPEMDKIKFDNFNNKKRQISKEEDLLRCKKLLSMNLNPNIKINVK